MFNKKIEKYKSILEEWGRKAVEITDKIILPGPSQISLFQIVQQFWVSITKGAVDIRAGAVAYSFFLAVFPSILFLFTLIPYIPIDGFQSELLHLFRDIMPDKIYEVVENTVLDIAINKRGSLLSFGFFAALIFSTNGVNTLIKAFNETVHSLETRNWFAKRAISLVIVIVFSFLISIAIGLIVFSEKIMSLLVSSNVLSSSITINLLLAGRWIVIVAFFYFATATLYFLAPSRKSNMKFFSPGASTATLLGILTSLGFSFYIDNFSRYNTLYGSIGTLIILLLWFYINALVLLVGFELNASIANAKKNQIQKSISQ
ncbi:MAG: YihY/virulence factor BrkB family protein [Salinivirgaceae bacterium]|jgi:membrane protein|nr:YihY/virulence factor BrkB family protein [Salinivirgaceae bacterium]